MKDIQVVHKKQQTLHSSLTVLGTKVDEVSNTAQQLIDNGHYASPDISANVTSLKQKYVYMCIRRCSSCNTQDEELYVHMHELVCLRASVDVSVNIGVLCTASGTLKVCPKIHTNLFNALPLLAHM